MTTTTDQYRLVFRGVRTTTGTPADLIARLRAVQDAVEDETRRFAAETGDVDVAAADALFQWARRQDFGPDAAQRIRREAWS